MRDWDSLGAMLDKQDWRDLEYYRLALRAKVFREQGNASAAKGAWLRAMKATDYRLERLSQLTRTTSAWEWNAEMEQVMKIIVARFPSEKATFQALVNWFYSTGNTAALKNLLTRVVEADPANASAKNNLAMTSLLLNPQDSRGHELAQEIYRQQPTNAFFVSTYAYALHVREKNQEALELFQKLKPEELEVPSVAAYYGIILNDTGHGPTAKKYLELGQQARLLPEELTLLQKARRGS